MKKLKIDYRKNTINWGKRQWLQHIEDSNFIVLTTGASNGDNFSGTAMPCESKPNGSYSDFWSKIQFKVLAEEIHFIISNNE